MRALLTSMLLILSSGCVVFPTAHYIYEPISSEGKRVDPEACGYMFNNEIRLVIEKPDYKVEVEAYTDVPEGKIQIFFRVVPSSDPINIDFNMMHVVLSDGNKIKPASVIRSAYGKTYRERQPVTGIEHLYKETNNFYLVEFSLDQPVGDEFVLVVEKEAISMGGRFLTVNPVTFKKSKKLDLYYGSLNC